MAETPSRQAGAPADIAVPFDYDADGTADDATWSPASGTWTITPSSGAPAVTARLGQAGDLPVPAAYDGAPDLAVLRPADGMLYGRPYAGGPDWSRPWGGTGGTPPPADHAGMSLLVSALDALAVRLVTTARYDEAVLAATQARDVLRRLTAANPRAYEPRLARASVMLGAYLTHAGRHDQAVEAGREGADRYRRLGDRPGLAWALDNLAARLSAAQRHPESVAAARESRDVYRALAAADPAMLPNEARLDVFLGAYLAHAGQRDAAIEAGAEGAAVYRGLNDPPDLAWALENLTARYTEAGRHAESVAPARESRDIHRGLAEAAPARRPDWARLALTLAFALMRAGRRGQALNAALEAVRLYAALAAADPAYRDELETARRLVASLSVLAGGKLIAGIDAPATATPGEPVTVTVRLAPEAPADTRVTINDLTVREARLQAATLPGPWRVHVTAVAGTERDERAAVIDVAGQPAVPALEFVQHKAPPLGITAGAKEIDAAHPVLRDGDTYRWRIGTIDQTTTDRYFTADLTGEIDHGTLWTALLLQLDVTHLDGTGLSVGRTLVVGSAYRLMRELGQIRPPVESDHQAAQVAPHDPRYRGAFTVRNLEPEPVTFGGRLVEWTGDDDELARFGPEEPYALTLGPGESATVEVELDRGQGHGAHGAVVHLLGTTAGGEAVHTSAPFALVRTAPPAAAGPEPLTRLERSPLRPAQAPGTRVAELAGVEPGADCDPDDLPDPVPENFACQFTGEYRTGTIPPRVANARKGDLVLVPGGTGMIGGLLAQVTPPQLYAHCGIMTRNFVEISHSTAANKWLEEEFPDGVVPPCDDKVRPTDGFQAEQLRYMWPGGITQSVREAYQGGRFTSPGGKEYDIDAFNLVDATTIQGRWQIIEPLVIKPHPLAERADPTIRQRLHRVADEARSLTVTGDDTRQGRHSRVHYRFYAYTDSAVALRTSPTGVIGPAPAGTGWAAGTLPTQCASFIWLAAKRAGVRLEGPGTTSTPADLEPGDVEQGAQVDAPTFDGLYFYDEAERRVAARWYVDFLTTLIFDTACLEAGWLAARLNEEASGMGLNCAFQIANTFAFDWTEPPSRNFDRWEDPGIGRAISPDHMMLWDRPEETGFGLWGYAEQLVHHDQRLEQIPVTKWRRTDGPALLNGTVRFAGAPAAGANVSTGGTETITGADGRFAMDVLEGRYLLKATKFIDDQVGIAQAEVDLTLAAGEVRTLDVELKPPPERYRLLQIEARVELNDDESPLSDTHVREHKYWELKVGPGSPTQSTDWQRGWGNELLVVARLGAQFNAGDLSVTFSIGADLYENEAGDEGPHDLDGSEFANYVIPKDATRQLRFKVWNENEGVDEDHAEFFLTVTNRTQL